MKEIEQTVEALGECAESIEKIKKLMKVAQETVEIGSSLSTEDPDEEDRAEDQGIPKDILQRIRDLQEQLEPKAKDVQE
jgi:hypothetical protein